MPRPLVNLRTNYNTGPARNDSVLPSPQVAPVVNSCNAHYTITVPECTCGVGQGGQICKQVHERSRPSGAFVSSNRGGQFTAGLMQDNMQ
jgi:hypothetical protein